MPPLPSPIADLAHESGRLQDLLIAWSAENSGSGNTEGLMRMAVRLETTFGALPGAVLTRIPLPGTPAPALHIAVRPGNGRRVLCSGHYDTVYEASHEFQACQLLPGGKLNGPGVADMKGGLVVMLAALRAFERLPCAAHLGWDVLLTPDEEIGSPHSSGPLRSHARGKLAALVFEPARSNGDLVRSRMGTGVITATCRGRAAHAAQQPNNGRNAIIALSRFLIEADTLPSRIPGTMLNVGSLRGGGVVNMVPDLACAEINVRASNAAAARALCEALSSAANATTREEGLSLVLSGGFERQPKECVPAEEALFASYQRAFPMLGLTAPSWQDVGGGSDGNLLSEEGLPNLDGLGIIGGSLHSTQEWCEPASIIPRAQAACLLLCHLAEHGLSD